MARIVNGVVDTDCGVTIFGEAVSETSFTNPVPKPDIVDSIEDTLVLSEEKFPSILSAGIG